MTDPFLFKVPQKAFIQHKGKILILKRSPTEDPYPWLWDFPGGKLESGEKAEQGIEREVREETGLKVKAEKPLFCFTEVVAQDPQLHVESLVRGARLYVVYQCKLISKDSKPKLSEEHTEYKWATKKEILQLKTMPYIRPFFKKQK